MPQLVFPWGVSGPQASPSRTWVPTQGTQAALAAVQALATTPGILCLYGSTGVGKTHLLALAEETLPAVTTADALESLTLPQQEALFHTFNRAKAQGVNLIVASRTPVAQCTLLPDLQSRLLTTPQLEMHLPTDAELHPLLARWAEARQIVLPEAVAAYVLARAERNPHTLAEIVAKLDTLSLTQKRAVTIPLAKELGI